MITCAKLLTSLGVKNVDPAPLAQGLGYGLMLLCAALFLLQRLPRLAAAGALASLLIVKLVFGLPFGQHTVEALVVVIVTVFSVSTLYWGKTRGDAWASFGLGLLAGYLLLMRQSAAGLLYLPLFSGAFFALLLRLKGTKAARMLWPLLLFGAGCFLSSNIPKWVFAANGQKFPSHGSGAPLYVGLGFAANPYNLAWDDDLAFMHGELLFGHSFHFWIPQEQEQLARAARGIMLRDPGLVARNVFAKAAYVIRFFSMQHDSRAIASDDLVLMPSLRLSLIMLAALITGAITLWRFIKNVSAPIFLLGVELAALAAAILAVMLGAAPFYMSALVSLPIAFLCIAVPVFLERHRGARTSRSERNAIRTLSLWMTAGLVLSVFTALGWIYRRERLNMDEARAIVSEPAGPQIDRLGFEYAWRFNRLSLPEQERVILGLKPGAGIRLYRPQSASTDGPFEPVAAVARGRLLYVVGRFDASWRMLLPSRVQGPRNSVLIVWPKGAAPEPLLRYSDPQLVYQKLPDANWDGRYHMICFPADRLGGRKPGTMGVYNFSGGTHLNGLVLAPVRVVSLKEERL